MKITDLAKEARVNRGQLGEYEAGKHSPSEPWIRKVENTLDRLEQEMGMDQPSQNEGPHLVRIKVEGVYGVKGIVVEGEPDDRELLIEMVDRIVKNLRDDNGDEVTRSGEMP